VVDELDLELVVAAPGDEVQRGAEHQAPQGKRGHAEGDHVRQGQRPLDVPVHEPGAQLLYLAETPLLDPPR